MAIRDILKMGDPRLLRMAQAVHQEGFDSDALHLLVSDLLDTMLAANGAGLAAPQIGVDLQVVVFGSRDSNPRYPERPLVPPTTTARIALVSKPAPITGAAVVMREKSTMAPTPAIKPQRV